MAEGLGRHTVPGRHTRRAGAGGLRRVCLATLIMLVAQYGVGIYLNLYVPIPASDAHAGFVQEIKTAPPALTVHALLGLALIGTAIVLLAKAVRIRDRVITVLAIAGLGAIGAAFAAGEMFVRDGASGPSFTMAMLTGLALLCYVAALAAARPLPQEAARPLPQEAARPLPQEAARPLPQRQAPALRGRPDAMPHPETLRPLPRRPLPAWAAERAPGRAAEPASAWAAERAPAWAADPAARERDFPGRVAPGTAPLSRPPANWFTRD
jgi:hypothetical protein